MDRMKSSLLILAAIALVLASTTALADDGAACPMGGPGMIGRGHGHGPLGPLGRIADELELTDEQKTEIRTIIAEEMPAARERIEERVSRVLTAEQQEKLAAQKAERQEMQGREGKRGMRGPGGPGARLERMADMLELTDDQKSRLREIIARAREEHRAEMQGKIDGVLTAEQKAKAEELREQRRERMAERGGPGAWRE